MYVHCLNVTFWLNSQGWKGKRKSTIQAFFASQIFITEVFLDPITKNIVEFLIIFDTFFK